MFHNPHKLSFFFSLKTVFNFFLLLCVVATPIFFFHFGFLHSRLCTFQCSTWCSLEQYFATLQRVQTLNLSCALNLWSISRQRDSEQCENLAFLDLTFMSTLPSSPSSPATRTGMKCARAAIFSFLWRSRS